MIGYHDGKKAYKLWDPVSFKVVTSRDVTFSESVVLARPPISYGTTCNDVEYIIEAIVDEDVIDRDKFYLVKWLGYSESENTWEPHDNVTDTEALLKWEARASSVGATAISEVFRNKALIIEEA